MSETSEQADEQHEQHGSLVAMDSAAAMETASDDGGGGMQADQVVTTMPELTSVVTTMMNAYHTMWEAQLAARNPEGLPLLTLGLASATVLFASLRVAGLGSGHALADYAFAVGLISLLLVLLIPALVRPFGNMNPAHPNPRQTVHRDANPQSDPRVGVGCEWVSITLHVQLATAALLARDARSRAALAAQQAPQQRLPADSSHSGRLVGCWHFVSHVRRCDGRTTITQTVECHGSHCTVNA